MYYVYYKKQFFYFKEQIDIFEKWKLFTMELQIIIIIMWQN